MASALTRNGGRTELKNRIFVMRHGEAESNVQDLAITDPKDGVPFYGLTDRGRQQAKEACVKLQESLLKSEDHDKLSEKLVIITSDFRRARETAVVLHDHFEVSTPLRLEEALRERGCGDLHKSSVMDAFLPIFEREAVDPTHTDHGCESLTNCVIRVSRILASVDEEFDNRIIVLVSHGDPLHVLWALVTGVPPTERMNGAIEFFGNCDFREVPSKVV